MENKKKKNFFLSNWEFFVWNWEKNILFGIGNGAEFPPQNRVIESPASSADFFQNQFFFKKNLSGTLSDCQMVWIQIRTDILLIWV